MINTIKIINYKFTISTLLLVNLLFTNNRYFPNISKNLSFLSEYNYLFFIVIIIIFKMYLKITYETKKCKHFFII